MIAASCSKAAQRRGQEIVGGADEADREPAGLARGDGLRLTDPLVELGEDAPGADEEGRAGRRQRDAAIAALEQRQAERVLELADRLAERRLRHVQALGGAVEIQFLGDGDELAQEPRLDHSACSCLASPAWLAITRCGLRQ